MADCSTSGIPTTRCDLGDSVPVSVYTTDPTTGVPVTPVSVACEVRRPDGTWTPCTLVALATGHYSGAYHTAGSDRGTHLGKVTVLYLDDFQTIDYFRVTATEPR
jgi:hypothetical protein